MQFIHHVSDSELPEVVATPHAKLAGKEKVLFAQRDAKLEAARERRRLRRAEAIQNVA
jgi:hypothetical protein